MNAENLVATFTKKAELVSAVVHTVKSLKEAFEYTVDICEKKEACRLLASGCEEGLSEKAEGLCETKTGKIIAAPGLLKKEFSQLGTLCKKKDFELVEKDLRDHLAGIDIGFTKVNHAIAETGTLVVDSSSEDLRLATMISEIHVAVLPVSGIFETSYDQEEAQQRLMGKVPAYTAFITGASRTADIERVLALGVHGPLELHILLLEDK